MKLLKRTALVFGLTFFAAFCAFSGAIFYFRGGLPPISRLESYEPAMPTTVLDRDGRLIHKFFEENRVPVPLDRIPPKLVEATVIVEDSRFYDHWGLDLFGIGRALLTNIRARGVVQGGSTITQQLARNLFLTQEQTLTRKIREALLAARIEKTYSKAQILELYLNQVYYGDGTYGVEAASRHYFGKAAEDLELSESALLVAIPKNPSRYSPTKHALQAIQRRNLVLTLLRNSKAISEQDFARAVEDSLRLLGDASRLESRAPYFVETVRRYLAREYGFESIYRGGLTVHTTLDADLQDIAEMSLENHFEYLEETFDFDPRTEYDTPDSGLTAMPYLQGAFIAIDPESGGILALIGGRSFTDSPFNRAVQMKRQPGSAFKPFVYLTAIENGYMPYDMILDAPIIIPDGIVKDDGTYEDWKPENFSETFEGPVTLRYALAKSINVACVRLFSELDGGEVIRNASQMGVTTPMYNVYSLALGSSDATLIDIVSAYSTFPNGGIHVEPYFISRIVDRDGSIIEENAPSRNEVLSPRTAGIMKSMLSSVVDFGTSEYARLIGLDGAAAGKTGTTNNCTDAWFVGFTTKIVAGAWVGYDDHGSMGKKMTGARMALPIWTRFVIDCGLESEVERFAIPDEFITVPVCAQTGGLATDYCPEIADELFEPGEVPRQRCRRHGIADW